ncbi:MAG: hypothetical protein FWC78_03735 [Defluviitaleaceae bacterium]|nr:hypothetical protein [Defluviitaleaceae bacterium]
MKRWWVVFEVLVSLLGVVFFIDMMSGILFYVIPIWQIRVVTIMLSFVLIPVAMAFPVIIGRAKLLLIPVVIFPLMAFLIYFSLMYALMVIILVTLIAVFGIVSGFAVKWFRKSRGVKRKAFLVVGATVLLTPLLLVGYLFAGAPIHSRQVNRIVREHVANTHPDFDLVVGRTRYGIYGLSGGRYTTRVYYANNREIFFEVWYSNHGGLNDRFRHSSNWRQNYEAGRISRLK